MNQDSRLWHEVRRACGRGWLGRAGVLIAWAGMGAPVLAERTRYDLPRPPAAFTAVYATSFEGVSTQDAHRLAWDMPHWFEFAARHREDGGHGDGEGGARMWVETTFAHTGSNCIGMELFDISKSRRCEFVIYPDELVGSEYYIECWLYLPATWGLFAPGIDWDWYELANPYAYAGKPYAALHIRNPDATQGWYSVALAARGRRGQLRTLGELRLPVPKGRWFHVMYYVKRDKTNGAVTIWFDGMVVAEARGLATHHRSHNRRLTISLAKIYYERSDTVPHHLWLDDLTVYRRATPGSVGVR